MLKINKLLPSGRLYLCQAEGVTCSSGPPGPPGRPGTKGARGRRGQKGRTGNKGDRGIMGSPGKSGKQGIEGPAGLMGEPGTKGEKGDMGPAAMPGKKGEPGESISSPAVVVSPVTLTMNEGGTASFQCSASGNPEPVLMWSNLDNRSRISPSAVSEGKLQHTCMMGVLWQFFGGIFYRLAARYASPPGDKKSPKKIATKRPIIHVCKAKTSY